jgi:hypothetical protein
MPKIDKSKMTPGQKAAHTRKWRRAAELAHRTGQNAKTFTRYFLTKKGYKCLSLDSRKGFEYKGVVDLIAVKRHKSDPDVLHIVLFQVKGGAARVTKEEIQRLSKVTRSIKVDWNTAEKPEKSVNFGKTIS